MGRKRANQDSKSSRENGSESRDIITIEKRAHNLRCNEGMKPTKVDANIELLTIMLQHHNDGEEIALE